MNKKNTAKTSTYISRRSFQRSVIGFLTLSAGLIGKPVRAQTSFNEPNFWSLFFPGLSDQVDYTPDLDGEAQEPVATTRPWDAVEHYTGTNTSYLAPKVDEFLPHDPPLPHFRPLSALEEEGRVYRVDLERSNTTGELEVEDQPDGFLKKAANNPDGFIAIIPPGNYNLTDATFRLARGRGSSLGARLVFRGEIGADGSHPHLHFSKGTINISEHSNIDSQTVFSALEMENLELSCDSTGRNGGPGTYLRYFRYDNVLFSGGFKNANAPINWPGIGIFNNCVFARAGRGGGLTHSFYSGYTGSIVARNCLFTSPKRQGHSMKVYASQIDMRGCTFASWWNEEDHDEEFYGQLAPLDMGAWSQSVISDCHFVRRGIRELASTRNTSFVDVRNRVYEQGFTQSRIPDYGTDGRLVDYHDVDNQVGTASEADPTSNLLFRHLFVNNTFINGLMPDGTIDPSIEDKPGFRIRNNGTSFNWAHGSGRLQSSDVNYHVTPTDYGIENERSVVYEFGSQMMGVPVMEDYPEPYGNSSDPSPVVQLSSTTPEWIQNRLTNANSSAQWWNTEWPSTLTFHPPALESE